MKKEERNKYVSSRDDEMKDGGREFRRRAAQHSRQTSHVINTLVFGKRHVQIMNKMENVGVRLCSYGW